MVLCRCLPGCTVVAPGCHWHSECCRLFQEPQQRDQNHWCHRLDTREGAPRSHRAVQRLLLQETRGFAGVATGWDMAGFVLQLSRPHLPERQLSHKCLSDELVTAPSAFVGHQLQGKDQGLLQVWSTPGTNACSVSRQRCHLSSGCEHWQVWRPGLLNKVTSAFLKDFPNPHVGTDHTHGGAWQLWQTARHRFGVDCSL